MFLIFLLANTFSTSSWAGPAIGALDWQQLAVTAARPQQHVAKTGLLEGCSSPLARTAGAKERGVKRGEELLDVVFIQLTVHSTDAHVLHHLNTTESCNTSA